MKINFFYICIILIIGSCTNDKKQVKIEKFIWLSHNMNWVSDTSKLQIKSYFEYNDDMQIIKIAQFNGVTKQFEYFNIQAPDSLSKLISKTFYKKYYPKCLVKDQREPGIYDGDFYLIICKFSGSSEQIINYKRTVTLFYFTDYIENIIKSDSPKMQGKFEINSTWTNYKKSISNCF